MSEVPLWIDFKLYFYVSNHKNSFLDDNWLSVVNWFQIVFLREQSQARFLGRLLCCCCELISNCIFTWAITRKNKTIWAVIQLWIDFKLYFYVSNHKLLAANGMDIVVVNWFQIVFLREQSQAIDDLPIRRYRCELISNCIFTWAITRIGISSWILAQLWIDFKLYFYVSNHKNPLQLNLKHLVVNWFQIVFLREQSQGCLFIRSWWIRCELISNCIFTWAITSQFVIDSKVDVLWIDFKLYFYVSNHKLLCSLM